MQKFANTDLYSRQHFTTEPSTFKALISSFSVLQARALHSCHFKPSLTSLLRAQPRFVRLCRQACSGNGSSEVFCSIPSLLVELSVAACQLHAASSSSSAPRALLTPTALVPLVANCVGACVARVQCSHCANAHVIWTQMRSSHVQRYSPIFSPEL